MTSLIISGIVILIFVTAIWLALRSGRQEAQKEVAEDTSKIKEKQLEASLLKPDKPSLIERLRSGRF